MNNTELLKLEALREAVRISHSGITREEIVATAKAFYDFLSSTYEPAEQVQDKAA